MNRALNFEYHCRHNHAKVSIISENSLITVNEGLNEVNISLLKGCVEKLLSISPLPTGVFIEADMFAVPLYSLLIEKGIIPGKHIHVISVNNEFAFLQGLRPRPATIDIRPFQTGQLAVELLLRRMENPQDYWVTTLIAPELVS